MRSCVSTRLPRKTGAEKSGERTQSGAGKAIFSTSPWGAVPKTPVALNKRKKVRKRIIPTLRGERKKPDKKVKMSRLLIASASH